MKKKLFVTVIAVVIALSGCGNTTPTPTESNTTHESTVNEKPEHLKESTATTDDTSGIQDIAEPYDVTMTLPADFVGETSQEKLDALAEENGYQSITLNDDGSATYTMTKSQHNALLQETADSINQSLSEMIGSETYPNITDVHANDDFTSFTVTTKSTELDLNESLSVMAFYMYGGFYAICEGKPVDNIHVDFVNADSGEVISSSDSSDM